MDVPCDSVLYTLWETSESIMEVCVYSLQSQKACDIVLQSRDWVYLAYDYKIWPTYYVFKEIL